MQIKLDAEIEVNGDLVHAPSILFLAGETATVEAGEDGQRPFRLEVDEAMIVTVHIPIYGSDGSLVGYPSVSMKPGESAEVRFEDGGEAYVVVVRTEAEHLGGVRAR